MLLEGAIELFKCPSEINVRNFGGFTVIKESAADRYAVCDVVYHRGVIALNLRV